MGVDNHGSIDVDGVTYVDCGYWFTERDDVFYIQPCNGACQVYLHIAGLMAWMMLPGTSHYPPRSLGAGAGRPAQ